MNLQILSNKVRLLAAVLLAGLIAGAAALSACGREKEAPSGGEPSLVDPTGSRAPVPAKLERIVSAAPSNTEIIAALGFADKLIAIDTYSASVEGISGTPVLIDFAYPDGEVILGLEPDIVFAAGHSRTVGGADPFTLVRETGITVVYIPTSVSIADIYRDIRFIAEALGVPERGERLAAEMRGQIAGIAETGAAIPDKRSVYFEISPFPGMVSFGRETYLNEMITLIGAVNIFAGETGWFSPSPEAILERNPDVILAMSDSANGPSEYPPDALLEEIRGRPGFETLNAVKTGRVYVIDADSASRPSHHIVAALKQMARAVYPDRFPAF
ncbi:MAG: ABC transporter substrate-binding protein [Spirochaetaceae bacterium]|jgi:iron complex transport system substrate-binding protein|nr:ABC transporter substrate-binding protein [Spirochaetaceae bacterium]